jgi:hypothetical protein
MSKTTIPIDELMEFLAVFESKIGKNAPSSFTPELERISKRVVTLIIEVVEEYAQGKPLPLGSAAKETPKPEESTYDRFEDIL